LTLDPVAVSAKSDKMHLIIICDSLVSISFQVGLQQTV